MDLNMWATIILIYKAWLYKVYVREELFQNVVYKVLHRTISNQMEGTPYFILISCVF